MNEDILTFADETPTRGAVQNGTWKVLVVDDDRSVHDVTRMILSSFSFAGKTLELISAYSEFEAMEIMRTHSDIAVVLLDVVMTAEDSGLRVVRYIREELLKPLPRIILRTGQPGQAPERKVIVDYDINDYKLKTELTADKLFVTLVSALRSYSDLIMLDYNRRGLERIIESAATLFHQQSFREFVSGVLIQMTAIMHLEPSAIYCRTSGLSAKRREGGFMVEAGIGDFENDVNRNIEDVLDASSLAHVREALEEKKSKYLEDSFIAYFRNDSGLENIIFITCNRTLNPWEKRLIEIFCTNISVALDNISLGEEIENTQREIIYTLGEVAEARSRETGHHVKRVAEYSRLLALKFGLEESEADMLHMAAPMHDVGKLSISDAILNKPGMLTDEEMRVMRTHAQAGYDMLQNSTRPILKTASIIALEHHERFDGTGYPMGKKGGEINLFGRIVAIADVFDALCFSRVYKDAWEMTAVLEYLRSERGGYFDPELIDIFLRDIDEFVEILKRFPE